METGQESRTEVAVNTRMRTFFSLGTPRRTGLSLLWGRLYIARKVRLNDSSELLSWIVRGKLIIKKY